MNRRRTLEAILVVAGALWAIDCGERTAEDGTVAQEEAPAGEPDTAGAVQAPARAEPGSVDAAMAELGGTLFKSKGCNACHTMGGGRLVGPDLSRVSERRERDYILAMIVNPDSMLVNDETARGLLSEYFTPMPNQGLTRDEAEALYEYFRHSDAEGDS